MGLVGCLYCRYICGEHIEKREQATVPSFWYRCPKYRMPQRSNETDRLPTDQCNMDKTEKKLRELIAEKLAEPDFEDTFLLGVHLGKGNAIDVFLDSDTGISFDKCRIVSRYREEW